MASPLVILVSSAVIAGILGSLFIIIALSVDTWEYIWFDNSALAKYSGVNDSTEYFASLATFDTNYTTLVKSEMVFTTTGNTTIQHKYYYLYPSYSGVWRICDKLSATARHNPEAVKGAVVNQCYLPTLLFNIVTARQNLEAVKGAAVNQCYTFITQYDVEDDILPDWMKSIGRMQNSAASCFIVSIIDVAAAAIVGMFAVFQKQVSACMVTGVLYCMAGLFSIFGLTIFHTKMYYEKYQCYSFDLDRLPSAACDARHVELGWAIPLTWVGVIVCVIAFGLWIFVTRAFRVIKSKAMI